MSPVLWRRRHVWIVQSVSPMLRRQKELSSVWVPLIIYHMILASEKNSLNIIFWPQVAPVRSQSTLGSEQELVLTMKALAPVSFSECRLHLELVACPEYRLQCARKQCQKSTVVHIPQCMSPCMLLFLSPWWWWTKLWNCKPYQLSVFLYKNFHGHGVSSKQQKP